MEQGKFITIEGIDGSGKTSVVLAVKNKLDDNFICTREPGGSNICSKIRELILSKQNNIAEEMSILAELALFTADRIQHLNSVIVPHLQGGKHVLCDRYADSTLAYQMYGRGIDSKFARTMVDLSKSYLNSNGEIQKIEPDKTIFLDVTPDELVARNRKQLAGDRIEEAGIELQRRIYKGYMQEINNDKSNRFEVVNARNDRDKVAEDVLKILKHATRR